MSGINGAGSWLRRAVQPEGLHQVACDRRPIALSRTAMVVPTDEGAIRMLYATTPWARDLATALVRLAPQQDAQSGSDIETYQIVDRDLFVRGAADLIMFMFQAQVDASEPTSWQYGGRARKKTWERLLKREEPDEAAEQPPDAPMLKSWLGEALAWWHELQTPFVIHAGRPFHSVNEPVIDSLSLVECAGVPGYRAVQAKTSYRDARPSIYEALEGFKDLQDGAWDDFWGERIRLFEGEIRDFGLPSVVPSDALGSEPTHLAIAVAFAGNTSARPSAGYEGRTACDTDGRALVLFSDATLKELVASIWRHIHHAVGFDAPAT